MNVEDFLNLISTPARKEVVKLSDADIETEMKLVSLDIKKETLESNRQDRRERKNYADKVFKLVLGFLSVSMLVVIASGIKTLCLNLSDSVLIALLTTTCANVVGIFLIVVKYLFRQQPG